MANGTNQTPAGVPNYDVQKALDDFYASQKPAAPSTNAKRRAALVPRYDVKSAVDEFYAKQKPPTPKAGTPPSAPKPEPLDLPSALRGFSKSPAGPLSVLPGVEPPPTPNPPGVPPEFVPPTPKAEPVVPQVKPPEPPNPQPIAPAPYDFARIQSRIAAYDQVLSGPPVKGRQEFLRKRNELAAEYHRELANRQRYQETLAKQREKDFKDQAEIAASKAKVDALNDSATNLESRAKILDREKQTLDRLIKIGQYPKAAIDQYNRQVQEFEKLREAHNKGVGDFTLQSDLSTIAKAQPIQTPVYGIPGATMPTVPVWTPQEKAIVDERINALLTPEEMQKVEKALAIDPDTAQMLAEYRKNQPMQAAQRPFLASRMPFERQQEEVSATGAETFARAALETLNQWYSPSMLLLRGAGKVTGETAAETERLLQTVEREKATAKAIGEAIKQGGRSAEDVADMVKEANAAAKRAHDAALLYENSRKFSLAVQAANGVTGGAFSVQQAAAAVKLWNEGKHEEALTALGGSAALAFMTVLGAYGLPELAREKFHVEGTEPPQLRMIPPAPKEIEAPPQERPVSPQAAGAEPVPPPKPKSEIIPPTTLQAEPPPTVAPEAPPPPTVDTKIESTPPARPYGERKTLEEPAPTPEVEPKPLVATHGQEGESPEATQRVESERERGVQRVRIDTRSGAETPIPNTVDAVDVQPGPYDRIVMRHPDGREELVAAGPKARPYVPKQQAAEVAPVETTPTPSTESDISESKPEPAAPPAPKKESPSEELARLKRELAEREAKEKGVVPAKPTSIFQPTKSPAQSLRDSADALQNQIDQKRNPAIAQQNVTARRARIASGMAEDADRLERFQVQLRALADAHDAGTVPDSLKGIKSRGVLEDLRYQTYPRPFLNAHDARSLLDATQNVPGTKEARNAVSRTISRGENGGELYGMEEVELVEKLMKIAQNKGVLTKYMGDRIEPFKRLWKAGIDTPDKFNKAKEDLKALTGEKPPTRTEEQKIKEAERELIGMKIPGYFPTPKSVAERMVGEADIEPGMSVLEPSAGKGNIADAIREAQPDAKLDVVEPQSRLRSILELKKHNIVGQDFLKHQGNYDRIVMNPPFENGQDVEHVQRAYSMLNPGGRIVSIMSPHPFFANDKKSVAFRDWFEKVGGTVEDLPSGTFTGKEAERQTGVASKLVVIDKPAAEEVAAAEREAPTVAAEPPAAPKVKEPWEMLLDDYVSEQFEKRYEKEVPAASRQHPTYRRTAEDSFKSKLTDEWYDATDKAMAEGKPVPKAYQPSWALTLQESADRSGDTVDQYIRESHKKAIQEALAEGKPVPKAVLADYSELAPKPKTIFPAKTEKPAETAPAKEKPKSIFAPAKPKAEPLNLANIARGILGQLNDSGRKQVAENDAKYISDTIDKLAPKGLNDANKELLARELRSLVSPEPEPATGFSLTPAPALPPPYIVRMADAVWDGLSEDDKEDVLKEFGYSGEIPGQLLAEGRSRLNTAELLDFQTALADLLKSPPMSEEDWIDAVTDKVWVDPRQGKSKSEVFDDEAPIREAAGARADELRKQHIRLTEDLITSEADKIIATEQQAALVRPMVEQDWEDALDTAIDKRRRETDPNSRSLPQETFEKVIEQARGYVKEQAIPLNRETVGQVADWIIAQNPDLSKPEAPKVEAPPATQPEQYTDTELTKMSLDQMGRLFNAGLVSRRQLDKYIKGWNEFPGHISLAVWNESQGRIDLRTRPELEPEAPKDMKLEWDKKENAVRGVLTLPDGQVVQGHWVDQDQMDNSLGKKRSEPGAYANYIRDRVLKQYVRQTDTTNNARLQQQVMDNVRPAGRPLVIATYDAPHYTGEFAIEPFVINDWLKYRLVERTRGGTQRWESAGTGNQSDYDDAVRAVVDAYFQKDGYRFTDPYAQGYYETKFAEEQAKETARQKKIDDEMAAAEAEARAKMEFRKTGKEEPTKGKTPEEPEITAKPTATAESSGKPLAESGLKIPPPKKVVPGIGFHKGIVGKRDFTIPALNEVVVKGGKMVSTDLDIAVVTPTNLSDGVYRLIGNEWVPGIVAIEQMPIAPINLPGKDGSIILPSFNDLARAERNITTEESRYTLNGALFKVKSGKFDIASTDGHRLSRNTYAVKGVPDGRYIVPRLAIAEVLRDKADGPVLISFDKDPKDLSGPFVTMQTGNVKVVTKVIPGQFPNYEAVMPEKLGQVAVIPKDRLLAALKDLKPYLQKGAAEGFLELRKKGENAIEITSEDPDRNVKKTVEVPVKYTPGGEAGKTAVTVVMPMRTKGKALVGLKHEYLLDAVQSVSGDTVHLGLSNQRKAASSPIVISGKSPVAKKGETIFDREKKLNEEIKRVGFQTKPLKVTAEWGSETARLDVQGQVIDDIAVVPTYSIPSDRDAEVKGSKPEVVQDSFDIYDAGSGYAVKYKEPLGREQLMRFGSEEEAKVAAMRMSAAKGYSEDAKRKLAEDPYQDIEELDKKEETRKPAIPPGPGGQTATSPKETVGTNIDQLTDAIRSATGQDVPLKERLARAARIGERLTQAQDATGKTLGQVQATFVALRDWYMRPEPFTDLDRMIGKFSGATQLSNARVLEFSKAIVKAIPDATRREAIVNWIQAGGDEAVLRDRAEKSKTPFKRGYGTALTLTPEELTIARNIQGFLDEALPKEMQDAGLLQHFVENYVSQLWDRSNKVGNKLVADIGRMTGDINFGKLKPNPDFIKKRVFESYFEGEQAGFTPKKKDIGFLVATHMQAYNKAIASRAFIKSLTSGKAADGRPLAAVSGAGSPVPKDEEVPEAYLIRPRSKSEEVADYRPVDHPALRKWKWVTQDTEGRPIMVQGDILIHPDAFHKIRNILSRSAIRTSPSPMAKGGRFLLGAGRGVKSFLLSFSGFHQVQEARHALIHRTNPFAPPKIDFADPDQYDLVNHGIMVAGEHSAMEMFSEGLASGAWVHKIPAAGPLLHRYQDWLFTDYIPRLKMRMATVALGRNRERYGIPAQRQIVEAARKNGLWEPREGEAPKRDLREFKRIAAKLIPAGATPAEVKYLTDFAAWIAGDREGSEPAAPKGKLSDDQILAMTGRQANAAFGELNYDMLGRNKTVQDMLRIGLLAPDFLEARARFVGQSLKPYGREQLIALAVFGAALSYLLARIANKIMDDDYHFDRPFSVVYKGREYQERTIHGDIYHLFSDPRSFGFSRINPAIVRPIIEALTGRDAFGRKRGIYHQLIDYLLGSAPIPLQGALGQTRDREIRQGILQAFGVNERKYRTPAEDLAHKYALDMMPTREQDALSEEEGKKIGTVIHKIRDMIEQKQPEPVPELLTLSKQEQFRVAKAALKSQLTADVDRLDIDQALEVWDKANKREKLQIAHSLATKLVAASKRMDAAQQAHLIDNAPKSVHPLVQKMLEALSKGKGTEEPTLPTPPPPRRSIFAPSPAP